MGNQQGKIQRRHHPQVGTAKKSVHWKTAECPSAPGRPILLALPDQPPDVICLRWEKPKLDGGSPIIGYTVEHRRVGSPHWVRATPMRTLLCEICISGLEPGWRYQFRVFAENIVGRSEPSDLSDVLTVTLQRNAICPPRFLAELQNFHAVEDERVEFRARFMGHPPPEINWFKDGYEIFSSRRTKISTDNESSVLIIHHVALTDEGEIKCTATNRAGHAVTKAHLLVEAPPKIRLPRTYEDGLIVEAEETLRLKVGIAGQPPPIVTWLHDNNVIINTGRFEIINSEKNSMLKIDNAQRDDRGEYCVKASNTLGEDIASFLVTITSRPKPPGKVRLNMSFGKSASLSWTAPTDDGGCKIGNYILEYFRIGWNVWLKAATTRSLNTTLHDLIEGSEYKFRVKAENPYGVSDPSEESDVLFIPDPKRGIVKPKSAELKVHEERKVTSPRRKTLSPPARSVADAATETTALRYSPKLVQTYKPQLLDTEHLHREMSYGTADVLLKQDVRKYPSPFLAHKQQDQKMAEQPLLSKSLVQPQLLPSPASSLLLKSSVPNEKDEKKSAQLSPIKDIMKITLNTVKNEILNNAVNKDEKVHIENSVTFANEKNQNRRPFAFQNLNKITEIHSAAFSDNQKTSFKASELKNTQRLNDFNNLKTPTLPLFSTGHINTTSLEGSLDLLQMNKHEQAIATSKLGNAIAVNEIKDQRQTMATTPTIDMISNITEITSTTLIPETSPLPSSINNTPTVSTLKNTTKTNTSNHIDRHDEVHTSNEFMVVVFNKNSRVKDQDKQDSFELDLEDAILSPPKSMSAPDLALLEYISVHTNFPIRRSVSSTELLYERAMARFYEAVKLEEAEKTRKLKLAQDKLTIQSTTARKRLGSMSEAERLSFEKRSELRRQSADITTTKIKKWTSNENVNEVKLLSRNTAMILSKNERYSFESQDEKFSEQIYDTEQPNLSRDNSFELGSDYTESTASSDEDKDSIERFKMEIEARTTSPPRELETYHPRNMSAGVFTPYRSPTPNEAAIILTKPVPLPTLDFVPKPILKKPTSNESVTSPASSDTEVPTKTNLTIKNNASSEKLDITKSIKSFFKRDTNLPRSPTPTRNDMSTAENAIENSNTVEKTNADSILMEAAKKRQAKEEEERRKREEAERIMKEEAQAAADHYSELVQQVSTKKKYSSLNYKDQTEWKNVSEETSINKEVNITKDKSDKKEVLLESNRVLNNTSLQQNIVANKPQLPNATSPMTSLMAVKLMKPSNETLAVQPAKIEDKTLPISEKTEVKNVGKEDETIEITNTIVSETVEERLDSRGRPRLVKVKKIIRKRMPSNTRSREASSNRSSSLQSNDNSVNLEPQRDTSELKHSSITDLKPLDLLIKQSSNNLEQDKQIELPTEFVKEEKSIQQLTVEAHENVRSAVNYTTDFILFVVACYVYLFKDTRLVLPILGLMIYRQMGEALKRCIPSWLKRRKPNQNLRPYS